MTERARIAFESADAGTRMYLAADVEMRRVPQMLAPFFSMVMKTNVRSLLKKFKGVLESPGRPVV